MSLLPFFQSLESNAFSIALRRWAVFSAMINVVHLLALVVFAGAVLIVDLRLLGRGMTKQPLAQVARDARPWLIGGFLGLLVTGIPQLIATPIKQYYSPFFWLKMAALLLGVIFTLTVRHKVTLADEARVGRFWATVVGLVSIAIWTSVAVGARLIGLLS